MAYRIIEITKPAECHVRKHQLIVEMEDGTVQIPLEDIEIILCIGAKIRFSTMGLGELNQAGILVVGFGKKHEPVNLIEPFCPNERHARILLEQIKISKDLKSQIWNEIIKTKILNQSRNLVILGLDGFERISDYSHKVHDGDIDNIEAQAAMDYFQFYHKGLNRRTEDPVNSALNYGYAIVRSYIIKALIATGFHCALGINHHNDFNSFNLADDLIEPWRAMVDQLAYDIIGNEIKLNSKQRKDLVSILHRNCQIDGKEMWISTGIDLMVDSFKNCIMEKNISYLKLPTLIAF